MMQKSRHRTVASRDSVLPPDPAEIQEVGRQPAVGGGRHIERLEEDRPGAEQKADSRPVPHSGQGGSFQGLEIHPRQGRDHLGSFGVEPLRMEDRRTEQVKRDRGDREDDHAEPGVELHHPDPASCAFGPALVGRPGTDRAGVPFLDAPVRIREQLGGPDTGDPEGREGQGDRQGGNREFHPLLEVRDADPKAGPLEDEDAGDREQRDQGHEDRRDPLETLIASRQEQDDRRQGGEAGPEVFLTGLEKSAEGRRNLAGEARHRAEASGNAMWAAWPTVPSIAAIWAWVASIMNSQSQQSHDVPSRGPGKVSNAASVVRPWVIAYRPSSTWTKTLIRQLRRISQRRLNPALAPRLVVLISSPVPTIDAARIRPGPI